MPKITPSSRGSGGRESVTVKTQTDAKKKAVPSDWWNGDSKKEIGEKLLATVSFLKEQQNYKLRQAAIYARMYGNMPLFGWAGSSFGKLGSSQQLPMDRPTMSVVSSCIDTLISRITQSRPRPVFLTDGADAKQRNLAKQLNNFIAGEFYQTKAYELGPMILRDACIFGTGIVKILEDLNNRVSLERRIYTELMVDANDSYYGSPRQLYELKLVDRAVLKQMFEAGGKLDRAENGYIEQAEEQKSISDLVIVAEGWHLPSGPDAKDGLHVIGCDQGVLFDEEWEKEKFPFAALHYSRPLVGYFGRGLAEQLMGTQIEINKLLITMSQAINLVGVPRVFVEEGSKVVKAQLNNQVGAIVTYRGTKPEYEVAPCIPQEVYAQLERLVNYAYQQAGISQLAAASKKPEGLTSGIAMREYDDLQTDRFAALSRCYDNMFVDLAYQVIDKAKEICGREGEYQTVYPNRDGTKQIDLPEADLINDPFVIQCFDSSSLPRDPAGRKAEVVELMQAGIITPQEGRRLLEFTDIQQVDKLENAAEERILQILDKVVEDGEFTAPDNFLMSVTDQSTGQPMAIKLATQYINLYSGTNLPEEKMQLLRDFFSQCQLIMKTAQMAAQQQQQQQMQQQMQMQMQAKASQTQGQPQPRPQSPMMNQTPPGPQGPPHP